MLSAHPATGRHLSRSLARYFMGGVEPSAALVDQLARDYAKSDGTISVVLSTLFHSTEFESSLDKQFKDPIRFVFSALRLAYDDREIQDTKSVERWLTKLGQGLFSRSTPDGYPLESKAWNSPGQLLARFEVARQIGAGVPDLFAVNPPEAALTAQAGPAEPPARGAPAPELKGDLYATILSKSFDRATQDALGQATSRAEWNTLFLSSPEFMK